MIWARSPTILGEREGLLNDVESVHPNAKDTPPKTRNEGLATGIHLLHDVRVGNESKYAFLHGWKEWLNIEDDEKEGSSGGLANVSRKIALKFYFPEGYPQVYQLRFSSI